MDDNEAEADRLNSEARRMEKRAEAADNERDTDRFQRRADQCRREARDAEND